MFPAHKYQCIRAFNPTQHLAYCNDEITVVDFFQEVNNDLCICFGLKYMTFFDELFLQ